MKKLRKNKAFTLIELLVVISIISALVAILAIGQKKVKLVSQNLRQKAAFHAAEISLELFSKDFGGYPDSSLVDDGSGTYVCGAQRMTEAFFGRDDRGFHPKSKWHPKLDEDADPPHPGADLYDANITITGRKKPYFERKRGGFYSVYDLWQGATGSLRPIYQASDFSENITPNKTTVSPVFTDIFEKNRVTINGESEKVGMPILYFKADATKKFRVDSLSNPVAVQNADTAVYEKWVFNFEDNLPIIELPWLRSPGDYPNGLSRHFQRDPKSPSTTENAEVFYELITEREDGKYYKPYNRNTFILISAGYDGIYGTKDDLTNFDY